MQIFCSYCGAANAARARFCTGCRMLIALPGASTVATPAREALQPGPRPSATIAPPPRALDALPDYTRPLSYRIDPATGLAYDPGYREDPVLEIAGSAAPAAFLPRLGAMLIDYCILSVLWFCLIGIAAAVDSAALGLLATILGPALYFVSFWTLGGRTPGYRAAGLQLVRTDGSGVGLNTSVVRYIGSVISWPLAGLGYLWMIWDPAGQTWHDKIADTMVVQS